MATLQKKFSDYAEATSLADGDLALISQFAGGSYVTKKVNLYQRILDSVNAAITDAGFSRGDYKWTNRPTVPSSNWLLADGTITAISSIPDYVSEYYIGDGNNADTTYSWHYKCTVTGTRDTAGTYFKIPDTRELAPTGVGTSGLTLIVTHDTYVNGQVKDDQSHRHFHAQYYNNVVGGASGSGAYIDRTNPNTTGPLTSTGVREPITDGTNGTPRMGATTRGKRFGAYCYVRVL